MIRGTPVFVVAERRAFLKHHEQCVAGGCQEQAVAIVVIAESPIETEESSMINGRRALGSPMIQV